MFLDRVAPSFVLIVVAVTGPCSNNANQQGPQSNPTGGYVIEVSVAGAEFVSRTIGREGEGCERFSGHEDAERTCFITTNLIPTIIGAEAYGELNERRTPAVDALIWRARADADQAVCAAGGLAGPFLVECEQNAIVDDYVYAVGNMRVRVPIGGAQPSPSP